MRLYLASTSPARLALLRSAGIEPVLLSPGVDEDQVVRDAEHGGEPLGPEAMVRLLARAKAEAVQGDGIDGFILGGDSAFVLDEVIYGKPHTPHVAAERWHAQRGRTGQLYSGHWLIDHRNGTAGPSATAVSVASVTFASDISDAEIDAYVATGEPLFVAGAFTIDSLGAPFISHIDGDPSTVVGLSLPTLRSLFRELGVAWPTLWNRA